MKRTNWYPANTVTPVRNGWYEWRCRLVTNNRVARAHWDGFWDRSNDGYLPGKLCPHCQWRGLAEKPK
jgi:hypothetical protein